MVLLGMVARSGSNKVEGVGRVLAGLAARTLGGDGSVKAAKSSFVWMGCKVQILTAWLGASGSAVPALICSITILLST